MRRILQLRAGEERTAIGFFVLQFFQGASIALLFTAAISIFLEELPVSQLPLVYVLSSFFLWLAGWLYAHGEQRLPVRTLGYLLVGLQTGGLLILWIFFGLSHEEWLFYAVLVFHNMVYLLYNLQFWGLVSHVYDLRESKRLFALVSSGDIPAKFLGYLAALLFVKKLGPVDLLILAAVFSLISVHWVRLTARHIHSHPHGAHNPPIQQIISTFKKNRFIRHAAIISFCSTASYLIVSFILYGYIKHEFHDEISLATFIAALLAGSHIFRLFIKLFLSGRLQRRVGLRNSLLVTPVTLLLFGAGAFLYAVNGREMVTLYFFGAIAILTDVLRSALQYPVLMSGMQSVPLTDRMTGHTIMKGVMDPFAFLLTGLLLMLGHTGTHEVIDFRLLAALLLFFLLLSVYFSLPMGRYYLRSLYDAIRRKEFNSHSLSISNEGILERVTDILSGDQTEEALFVIRIIDRNDMPTERMLRAAFQNTDPEVRRSALQAWGDNSGRDLAGFIREELIREQDPAVRAELAAHLIRWGEAADVEGLLKNSEEAIRYRAIGELISMPQHEQFEEAVQQLNNLLSDQDSERRINGLRIISPHVGEVVQVPAACLLSPDRQERVEAIRAVGRIQDEQHIDELMELLSDKQYRSDVIASLSAMPNLILPKIDEKLQAGGIRKGHRELLLILAAIETPESAGMLLKYYRMATGRRDEALYHMNSHSYRKTLAGSFTREIDQSLTMADTLFNLETELEKVLPGSALKESLHRERRWISASLCSLIYLHTAEPRLRDAYRVITGRDKWKSGIALELIDQLCGKEIAFRTTRLLEAMSEDSRKELYEHHGNWSHYDLSGVVRVILDPKQGLATWLQAHAANIAKENNINLPAGMPETGAMPQVLAEVIKS